MTRSVLPSPEEIPSLVPRPGSVVWDRAGDARALLGAGYALVLQVAHPTVAAGVREHSNFERDPWGSLLRTLDFVYTVTYGGPEAAASAGRRLRRMHEQIKGVDPAGRPYHALEPEAFAWVHATLVEAQVRTHERFGRGLSPDEIERFYAEFRSLGRLFGVREEDLPDKWPEFCDYRDAMEREVLERNDVVDAVLSQLEHSGPPPVPLLWDRAWAVARIPIGRVFRLATVGLLRPELRRRLGLPWSRLEEIELSLLATATRAATGVLPAKLRNIGPAYLDWRQARDLESAA
jgi:uncharacterized protein (DUF2236 family)